MSCAVSRSARFLYAESFRLPLNLNYISKVYSATFSQQLAYAKSTSLHYLKLDIESNLRKRMPCFLTNFKKYSTNNNNNYKQCWNCISTELHEYFCHHCKVIQPLDKKLNCFEVLGLEKSFKIYKNDLIKKYRKLQNIFHPDKFSVKSKKEQELAAEFSSFVNKAFTVILHPVSRGEYMLSLAGHSIEEGELTMDPEFLMSIMDINERLADAKDLEIVQDISNKNNSIMDSLLREAEEAFESNDIAAARGIVAKLKYYNNIYEKVKEYETKHGIIY